MKSLSFIMLFLSSSIIVSAYYGVDTSVLLSTSTWKCLLKAGKTYAIIRGFQSNGLPDPNLIQNLKNANSGGIKNIDIIIYPCVSCSNGMTQVENLMQLLRGQNYGMIWIAVVGSQWPDNNSGGTNQDFLIEVGNQILNDGKSIGIYTSYADWNRIMGVFDYFDWSDLWYYDYDNQADFKDFQPFSYWNTPTLKQYNASSILCGATVGLDWG